METQRWPRGAGEDGETGEVTAALLAEAAGRGERTYFAHVSFSGYFGCPVSGK